MSESIILAIKAQDREVKRLTGEVNRLKSSTMGLGGAAKIAASALGAIGLVTLARNAITTSARFQDLRTTLASVTGSTEEGAKAFDFIKNFATETQFGVEELTQAYIKLSANGLDPSRELLTTFTDAAAVTSDQIGSLQAITDFYTRSLQSQTVELMDLDRLADRGLPVYDILKEKLGVSRSELSKFAKEAGNAELVVKTLGESINERYGGATAALLGNMSVQFSNLGIAVKDASDVFGMAMAPAIGETVTLITDAIKENEDLIKSLGQGLGKSIRFAVANLDILAIALAGAFAGAVAVKIVTITTAAIKLTKAFRSAAVAGTLLQGVTGVGLIKVAAGVTAATAVIVAMDKAFEESTKEIDKNTKSTKDNTTATGHLTKVHDYEYEALQGSIKATKDLTKEKEKQAKANEKLLKSTQDTVNEIMRLGETEIEALRRREAEKLALLEAGLKAEGANTEAIEAAKKKLRDFTQGEIDGINKDAKAKEIDDQKEASRKRIANFKDLKVKLADTEKLTQEELGQVVRDQAGKTLDVLATQNKKFFQIQKAAKIAAAVQDTAAGIMRGFAQGGILGFVYAGLIAAAGAAQIAAIRAQSYPGREMGGPVDANRPYIVGEGGPELFVPGRSGTVVPNGAAIGGQVTVNFNIQAIDTSDFDDLLLTRQDMIVGLINRAMRERGKRAITV
tara:strand:- start:1060 stop:3105 length:2046 start_codon:yes stop_codon:yes gene_type:complete